jgi:hypothetical protein
VRISQPHAPARVALVARHSQESGRPVWGVDPPFLLRAEFRRGLRLRSQSAIHRRQTPSHSRLRVVVQNQPALRGRAPAPEPRRVTLRAVVRPQPENQDETLLRLRGPFRECRRVLRSKGLSGHRRLPRVLNAHQGPHQHAAARTWVRQFQCHQMKVCRRCKRLRHAASARFQARALRSGRRGSGQGARLCYLLAKNRIRRQSHRHPRLRSQGHHECRIHLLRSFSYPRLRLPFFFLPHLLSVHCLNNLKL